MAWRTALRAGPAAVAVTSFNEWGEGTQVGGAESCLTSLDHTLPVCLPACLFAE
jgi:hypothetical protein